MRGPLGWAEEGFVRVQGQGEEAEAEAIARKNAEAEAAFKKKFGNAKPNAKVLLQRQRQHETRYFDSGGGGNASVQRIS